ncbi:hypothetical protein SPB21_03555 [Leptothoe sp. ISB3NOV94-8A]
MRRTEQTVPLEVRGDCAAEIGPTAIHRAVDKIYQSFGESDPISALVRQDAYQLYETRLGLEPGIMGRAYKALKEV